MKSFLALLVLAATLSGCAVHTPSGSVIVDPEGRHSSDHHHGHGDFCPPGQAKKGNC